MKFKHLGQVTALQYPILSVSKKPDTVVDTIFIESVYRDSGYRDSVYRDSVYRDSVYRDIVYIGSVFIETVYMNLQSHYTTQKLFFTDYNSLKLWILLQDITKYYKSFN